jgi:hypothetical protein
MGSGNKPFYLLILIKRGKTGIYFVNVSVFLKLPAREYTSGSVLSDVL